MRVYAINGKWTKHARTRQPKRYWLKYIVGMTVFGVCLALLINS